MESLYFSTGPDKPFNVLRKEEIKMKKTNQRFREILLPFVALHGTIAVLVAWVYIVGLEKVISVSKLFLPTFPGPMHF
jgi:hypothetical protein